MSIIVLDTETTGLPRSRNPQNPQNIQDFDTSRIIELAYIIYDENRNEILRKSYLIKQDNFTIKNDHIHGITNEMCSNNGRRLEDVFSEFEEYLTDVTSIVAHNAIFDINVILSECYRYGFFSLIDLLNSKNIICTYKLARQCSKIKRSLKLTSLYSLFFEDQIEAHRALNDVIMCSRIYFHMTQVDNFIF